MRTTAAECRVELVQVRARLLPRWPPLIDEIVTMIDEQLELAVHPLAELSERTI